MGRGKAAAQLILRQPAKSELLLPLLLLPLLLPLLPTLLLLKPLLLLLTSQMATLGLTQRLVATAVAATAATAAAMGLGPGVSQTTSGCLALAARFARRTPFWNSDPEKWSNIFVKKSVSRQSEATGMTGRHLYGIFIWTLKICLLYTSPSPRDS